MNKNMLIILIVVILLIGILIGFFVLPILTQPTGVGEGVFGSATGVSPPSMP